MANALAVILHAFGAESGSGSGPDRDIEPLRTAAELTLSAQQVVGTLAVTLQTSPDGTSWRNLGTFDAITASSGAQTKSFFGCDRHLRVTWPSGTSAVFSVAGQAHTVFATRQDLRLAMPARQLSEASDELIAEALIKGSADVEDALLNVGDGPITEWSPSVRVRAAAIAAYHIMLSPGFAGAGIDELVVKGWDDAQKWLTRIAKRDLAPAGVSPTPDEAVQTSGDIPDSTCSSGRRFSGNWGDFG